MAEQRSERLKVVLMVAEREEQAAAARLGEARQQLEQEEGQLAQLQDYRDQYLADYREQRRGVNAQSLMSYSGFLQRLGDALGGQEQKLALVRQQLEQCQRQWQEKYHRRRSLEDMIARMRSEENAALEQRQQRELDDLAAQRMDRTGLGRKR